MIRIVIASVSQLGKNGGLLRPELFIGKYGVTCIFLFSGLSLELSELSQAIRNVKLNGLTQFANFALWPLFLGLPVAKGIEAFLPSLLPKPLLDGILVMTCLPTTVNMCIILATAAGGNVASALCNAVIGNIFGIFATPALLLRFLGTSIDLPFVDMILKLCNKVLVPVAIGQGLRATPMKNVYNNNPKKFKRLQEYILLGTYYKSTAVWQIQVHRSTLPPPLNLKPSYLFSTISSFSRYCLECVLQRICQTDGLRR